MTKAFNEWQLQEAQNKLGELVKEADKGVPQYIRVHGKSKAVLISTQEYQKLKQPEPKLSSALLKPILEEDDDLFTRVQDTGRSLEL